MISALAMAATVVAVLLVVPPRTRGLPARLRELAVHQPPARRWPARSAHRRPDRGGAARLVAVEPVRRGLATIRSRRRASAEVVRARDELPDVIDLLRLGVAAGLNVHLAVMVVAEETDGPIHGALREVVRRTRLGIPMADALDALLVLGDPVRSLHRALVAAARDGTPLSASLDRLGDEARANRRRAAEVRARRLPVQLLFPLVFCILPAFGLLTVVPLLAGSLGSLPL